MSRATGIAERITFHYPGAFWFVTAATVVGVVLHLPMYIGARAMGYRMAGMALDAPMVVGMVLILVGLAATLYGLLPPSRSCQAASASPVRVTPLDDVRISSRPRRVAGGHGRGGHHRRDEAVTLSFVVPGVAEEYGLRPAANPSGSVPVAYLPLAGITGTVLGLLLWGWLGDRIGRRASILFAGVLFIATSICGACPALDGTS